MIKIGLQMYTVRDQIQIYEDFISTLDKISAIGIKLLQMGIPGYLTVTELKKILDGYGMRSDAVYFPSGGSKEQFDAALSNASVLGTNLVQTGSIPADLCAAADGYRKFAEIIDRDGEMFTAAGFKYIYHFHAFEFVNFGGIRGIDILLNETDKNNVYFEPDVFWLTSAGTEPSSALKMFAGRTNWIHAKDYAIMQLEGIKESIPFCFAPVGEGNLNWDGIINTAKEIGVEEFIIEQDFCKRDVFDSIKSSYDFLKKKLG
ncbi:MAG: sugar phosphate isomerase/epimerase [Oscillospiraceae bacterium]|nr:sugar phosphate isomerase/epimerase [Oscillospiraceae bacterium]